MKSENEKRAPNSVQEQGEGQQRIIPLQLMAGESPSCMNVLNNIPSSVSRYDKDLKFVLVNKAFLFYMDKPMEEIIGKNSQEIGIPEPIARLWTELLKRVMKTGEPEEMETFHEVEGTLRYVMTRVTPEFSGEQQIVSLLAVGTDITDQRIAEKAEAEIRQENTSQRERAAENRKVDKDEIRKQEEKIEELNQRLSTMRNELAAANSELNTFNSVAANDYKEMLKHLYVNLEHLVMNESRNLSNAGRANLRRAQATIQKMNLLTDDLVSYWKLHEENSSEKGADLYSRLLILEKAFRNKGVKLEIDAACQQLSSVTVYPSLVALLFHHLVEQASRTRKEKEPLKVEVTCDIAVKVEKEGVNGRYHIISFRDNGKGIEKEDLDQVFNIAYGAYSRNRLGIGLALCKKIMETHKGFIEVESEVGVGSRFLCYFPA